MPTDNSFWFQNNQRILPIIPKEIKNDPKQAIFGFDLCYFDRTVQNYELLMQC
jgi:hypothetical protein